MLDYLSICIATYNSSNTIKKCLSSIPKKILGLNVFILILDDGSTDCTVDTIIGCNLSIPHKIIKNQVNKESDLCNKLIKSVQTNYFLFLDLMMYFLLVKFKSMKAIIFFGSFIFRETNTNSYNSTKYAE